MYDVIIIGAGPAGLSAGLYCTRAGLKTLIFERLFPGGQAALTSEVDNYIGTGKTDGASLCMKMSEQAMQFGLEMKSEEVKEISLCKDTKEVTTSFGKYESKAVILCMGARPKKLGAIGEDEFLSRGVSYCATCDGNFYRDKTVCVIGGGDTAAEDALYLSNICKKVYLIHRRKTFRANNFLISSAEKKENIEFVLDSVCEKISGNESVESVEVKNVVTGEKTALNVSGVFCAVGTEPNSELVKNMLFLNGGYIVTDENMRTSEKNVYAAGDIRVKALRQIVTAASDGAIASKSVFDDLTKEEKL